MRHINAKAIRLVMQERLFQLRKGVSDCASGVNLVGRVSRRDLVGHGRRNGADRTRPYPAAWRSAGSGRRIERWTEPGPRVRAFVLPAIVDEVM
jgi:hypothetical protein